MINYNNSSLSIASSVASDNKGSLPPSNKRKPDSHVATKMWFAKRQIGDFLPKRKPSKSRIISILLVIALLANVKGMAVALEFDPEIDCFDSSLDLSSAIPVQFGSPTYEHTHPLSHRGPIKNANPQRRLSAQTMGKKKLKKQSKSHIEYDKVSNLKCIILCCLQWSVDRTSRYGMLTDDAQFYFRFEFSCTNKKLRQNSAVTMQYLYKTPDASRKQKLGKQGKVWVVRVNDGIWFACKFYFP